MSFWEYLGQHMGYVITVVAVIAVIVVACLIKSPLGNLIFKNKKPDETKSEDTEKKDGE